MPPVLIIFAKAPAPGKVKTRLVPPLSLEGAALLHDAFVRDTIELCQRVAALTLELHTNIETDAWSDLEVPRKLQYEGDLGLKMLKALEHALQSGAPRAVVLGSDSPHLPPGHLGSLINSEADIVLGPSEDGGYYAISARRTHPQMFAHVRWSTSHALADTLTACAACHLTTALGPSWFDIDTPAELDRLIHSERIPPNTHRALRNLPVSRGLKSA
jgi:uncharacterized protein